MEKSRVMENVRVLGNVFSVECLSLWEAFSANNA